jgi:hypothetical protein
MKSVEVNSKLAGLKGSDVAFWVHCEVWVVALVGKEGGDTGGGIRYIVVCKFCKRKEVRPVRLLVVAVDADVLLECLIHSLGLAITFRMITRCEVKVDVEKGAEGAEEVRDKFRSTVGCDVIRDSMFGKDMSDEELGEFLGGAFVSGRDEDGLLRESVDDY